MGGLRTIIGGVVIDKILSARAKPASKSEGYHVMVAFAGLFVVVGCVFLLIALYNSMCMQFTDDKAALITACASMIIALLTVLAANAVREHNRPKIDGTFHDLKSQFEGALKGMEGDWEKPIRENPKTAAALAALAGYILADKIV